MRGRLQFNNMSARDTEAPALDRVSKPKRDFPSRSEETKTLRVNAPPSRHLWVGNLSINVDLATLAHHFSNFGELENIAFQPGRSYAFVNFVREEEAISAMRSLQGLPLAGMGLKIEFTKSDKSSASLRTQDNLLHRDDQRSQRDVRAHNDSIDLSYSDRSKMNGKDEPCEVLWIGFPASLRVDEPILRKAFAPFGEIEKITAFPGRSYAFVQFADVMSACRAKETLHGKLFGNPRVHICFSRSDNSSSHGGKSSSNPSPSPATHYNYSGPPRFPMNNNERNFPGVLGDLSMKSPSFLSNVDHGHPDALSLNKECSFWTVNSTLEKRKYAEMEPDLPYPENRYERRRSPITDRDPQFPRYSPQKLSRRSPLYDFPEENLPIHDVKKLKTGCLSPQKELPKYPLTSTGFDYGKQVGAVAYSDHSHSTALEKSYEPPGFSGHRKNPDQILDLTSHHKEGQNKFSHDSYRMSSGTASSQSKNIPELQAVSNKEWKWEGTIAKSGTPVCHARCFPVGKVMDNTLPGILDCTARTGLDMLAKHYYSASDSWVVFFAPHSDGDIGFYDEFMHYLEEKQRAAVAKLDEAHTLFLVPPSEFSEKVLKVPGKLSISGLILKLEHPGLNFGSSSAYPSDRNNTSFTHLPGDPERTRSICPRPLSTPTSLLSIGISGVHDSRYPDSTLVSVPPLPLPPPPPLPQHTGQSHAFGNSNDESMRGNRQEYKQPHHQQVHSSQSSWSYHPMSNPLSASGGRNEPVSQEHQPARSNMLDWSSVHLGYDQPNSFAGASRLHDQENQVRPPSSSMSLLSSIQPEQLAQLASSILSKRTESAPNPSVPAADFRPSFQSNQPDMAAAIRTSQAGGPSEYSQAQAQDGYQQQLVSTNVQALLQQQAPATQTSQFGHRRHQIQSEAAADSDPQKRLQATLQLAAALLQKIQQGKAP